MERAPSKLIALHPDLAVHAQSQLSADRQPKTSTPNLASRRTVNLRKSFKNLKPLGFRNAAAGIFHHDVQREFLSLHFPERGHRDRSLYP